MKETSAFVMMITLVTLLPCQAMPPNRKVTLQQTPSQNTVQPDNSAGQPNCNVSDITEPPSFFIEKRIYSERRYFLQMTSDGRINGVPTNALTNNINGKFLIRSSYFGSKTTTTATEKHFFNIIFWA